MAARRSFILRAVTAGLAGVLVFCLFGFTTLTVQATASIAQSFEAADADIVTGAILSLKQGTPNAVEMSTRANTDHLLGVVGEQNGASIAVGDPVQVATSGLAPTLVSDINGTIKAGDKITASPIAGVGMKATETGMVVGTAQGTIGTDAEGRTVKDKSGKEKTVRIGVIALQIAPVFYEVDPTTNSFVPSIFQDFANRLAGHSVSPVRVLIAGLLIILLVVAIGVLLYASVRSSIISIGRNPLSKSAVKQSLFQVGVIIFGVLVFAMAAIYLLLAL